MILEVKTTNAKKFIAGEVVFPEVKLLCTHTHMHTLSNIQTYMYSSSFDIYFLENHSSKVRSLCIEKQKSS